MTVTALVLVDLQNATVGAPTLPHTGPEVVVRAAALLRAFHEKGAPVVLVRVTADAVHALPEGWDAIVDDLAGHPDDVVVTKRGWNAFHGTDLDPHLRRRGVTRIVLAGLTTSMGVESTARAAHDHGYHVTLATDAMADLDPEAHRNSVERIFPRLGECRTTAEIVARLTGNTR